MPPQKPLFWRAFDAAEKAVAPRLEDAVRSGPFLDALSLAARARRRVERDLESRSRRLWHMVNLPAGSDVTHLRRQVAQLDRELRQVTSALERALAERDRGEEDEDAGDPRRARDERPARARRAAGTRPPGRRAQRSSGP